MTHCDIQVITEFCSENGIVLLADEVYQTNVYAEGAEFVSAKKVAMDLALKNLQLVSFHSTSKGLGTFHFWMCVNRRYFRSQQYLTACVN